MALSGMSMDMPDLSESSMPDFSSLISFGDLNLDLSDAIDPERDFEGNFQQIRFRI